MKRLFRSRRALARAGFAVFASLVTSPVFASSTDPSGNLDTTFGPSGLPQFNYATLQVPADSRAIVMQSSGKVVVAGGSNNGLYKDFVITRLNTDGTVDSSFGAASFGVGGVTNVDMGFDDHINALAQNSTGSRMCGGGITGALFGVACFTANGLLDTSFNSTGIVKDNAPASVNGGATAGRIEGITFDRNNKPIAVGWGDFPTGRDWIIRRWNTDGTPDNSFGNAGWVTIDHGGSDRAFDVAIIPVGGANPNNDIIAVTGTKTVPSQGVIALLNMNGTLYTTNNSITGTTGKGYFTPSGTTQFRGVGVQSDNDHLVVTGQGGGFIVARYSLSSASVQVSSNLGASTNDVGYRVRIGAGDKVYVSGTTNSGVDFGVARLPAVLGAAEYVASTSFSTGSDFAYDLAVNPSTGFVTACGTTVGDLSTIAVARYNTSGVLDTGFNSTGKYYAAILGGSSDESVAFGVQSDGNAVVAGTTFNSSGDYDLLVTRIKTDGTRDTTGWASATNGWDTRGFSAGSAEQMFPGGVAIDGNGEALVVGTSNGYFALRYNTNGTLDTSFNTTGIVLGNWGTNSEGKVVAIDSSNNVIVGGDITLNGDFKFSRLAASNGALDTTFGSSGTATVNIASGQSDVLNAIALDPIGNIVAAGECANGSGFFKMCLARLTSSGSLDTSFNGTGKVFLSSLSGNDTFDIRSLQLLPNLDTPSATDYKIVVAGQYVQSSPSQAMWLAARFNMDGSLDTSFNAAGSIPGVKTFTAGPSTYIGSANSVALQYDEKLVLVGESSQPDPQNVGFYLARRITVARLNWDGTLDTTFGTNGFTYTSFASDPSEAHQVYVYPQSNATLKGEALLTPFIIASDFAMNRYLADPGVTNPSTPDLLAADDSGRSNTDNYTNVTSPHFTGTCGQGDTVYILVNGAQTQPRSRAICTAAGMYNVQVNGLSGNPATQYSLTARSQNGVGDSATSAALSITVDTVVVAPVISSVLPTAGVSGVLPHPTISGTSEGQADVVVANNAPGNGCASPNYADNSGNWTCNSTFEQGLHTNVSVIQTDLAGNVSTAATTTFRVKIPTATTISHNVASPPAVYGQNVTFTANVAATGSYAVQTDFAGTTIHIQIDGVDAATPSVSAAGVATFSTSTLSAGTHSIKAIYDENNNWVGSTSSTITLVVIPANTTTAVVSSLNPSVFGQSVTFTATVADSSAGSIAVPTGAVQFVVDGVNFGSPVTLTGGTSTSATAVSGATATLNVAGASHTVAANYVNADGNFNNSSGAFAGGQIVNPAATSTAVVSSLNPSTVGQSVQFSATVTDTASTAAPTGTVQFVVDGTNFASPVALAGASSNSSTAQSQATTTLTVVGSPHSVTANYVHADANFSNSSGSLSGGQTVLKITTTTTVTASQSTITLGDTVTFTATVSAPSSTAQGIVTFFDGSSPIGSALLSGVAGNDQASITTSLLSAAGSPHSIKATFESTPSFASSTSAATVETVNRRTSTTGVVLNPPTVVVGQPSTATVTVTDSGSVPPGTADTFAATGAPAVGRTGFTATLFGDGLVLVAGGTDASNNVLNSAEIYNASGASFTSTGNLKAARTGGVALLLPNGQVLIAGGSSDGTANGALDTAELFDPSTRTFTATSHTMNAARLGASAVLLNTGKVFLAGGANSGGVLNTAELYDATADTFALTGNLNAARSGASATLLGTGKVLVAGGSSDGTANGARNNAEVFDPAGAGTFTSVAGAIAMLSDSRWQPEAALLLSGKVLIAGGVNSGGALTSADLYDPVADSFTATGKQMSQARAGATAVALPTGMVLLAGGTTSQVVDLYNGDSDQFNTTGSLQQSDTGLQSIPLNNGQVLVVGLTTGATPASDAQLYAPSFNPLGTVALTSSEPTDAIGTCVLSPSTSTASICTASVTPANVVTSPHTITGTYPADTVHAGSNNSASLTTTKSDTTTPTVTSSANPSAFGQSVTFTATVSPVAPGAGTPTGTVTFLDGGSSIGTGTLGGGVATFTTSTLAIGNHTITTSYGGDGNFNGSTGSLTGNPQVVSKATTTTTINSITPPGPITLGSSVSVSASVATGTPNAGTPSGTIAVSDGGAGAGDSCTITIPGTSCTLTPSSTGSHPVTAAYSGDSNFLASTSSATNLSVTPPTRTITASAGPNGSITPATQYVVDGNTANFTVTPNSGYAAIIGGTCPTGTLSNNTYTTGLITGDCSVMATFASALTSVTLLVTDNDLFARYGTLVNYIVTASNASGADVTGLSISGGTSPDLDTSGGHWQCFGSASQCAPSGAGPFSDNAVTVPAKGSVSWVVTEPVLGNAPDTAVSFTVTLNGPSFASPITQTDTDTLVVFRDGFNVPYGDGTQSVTPAPTVITEWDGSTVLMLDATGGNAMIEPLLSATTADHSGFRVERLSFDRMIYVRLVAIGADGTERCGEWLGAGVTGQLVLRMINDHVTRLGLESSVGEANLVISPSAHTAYRIQGRADAMINR